MSLENSSFYTFLVTSHVNTAHSEMNNELRFNQTLETLRSIRSKVANSKILFCDSSTSPLNETQYKLIDDLVDKNICFSNNLFTRYVSNIGLNKGLNEMLVLEKMLQTMKAENLVGKRIFKLSGRYLLKDNFDIMEYEKPEYQGKYVYRVTTWWFNEGAFYRDYFNTVLYSMCTTLVDHYINLLEDIFSIMLQTSDSMEHVHNLCTPKDKLLLVPNVHGCGYMANGQYIEF